MTKKARDLEACANSLTEAHSSTCRTKACSLSVEHVMGAFEAALRDPIYSQPPQTVEDFLAWIKQVNATVMRSRPEKNPGEWKSRNKGFKLLSPLTGEKMAVPL